MGSYGKITADWADRTTYIIGGGASLSGFDFDLLKNKFTVGPNAAALRLNTDVFVTLDRNFYRHRSAEISAYGAAGGDAYVALHQSPDVVPELLPHITYLEHARGTGMSPNAGCLYGLHSGYAAVNLAILAGCKDIRLLGFDMHFKSGDTHWHGGYHWHRVRNDRLIRRWAVAFDEAVEDIRREGVQITNYVGPLGSTVTTFPTALLSDLYEELTA